jgi:hypothetical protein
MKHYTHIYLAAKAIEFTKQSVDNMIRSDGRHVSGYQKRTERDAATDRQRILQYYQDTTMEASWAPDDVLHDNDPYHIFKLFTDEEFPNHGLEHKPRFEKDGVTYYKFAGGLPYRIDHLAQQLIDMSKLRDHNDQFSLKQIVYGYMLISHYVVDAHVPMHCDLRDDPPSDTRNTEPSRRAGSEKPAGRYVDEDAHGALETLWDDATTPVAIREEIIPRDWDKVRAEDTPYSKYITFDFEDCKKNREIKVPIISGTELMNFMINVCIKSKQRAQILFPVDNPEQRNDAILGRLTREIFADCIGNLMAVWRYIWTCHEE